MGDCGSHAIGALIAVSALLMKIELVVLVASGMFFLECLSSLVQIISIRCCIGNFCRWLHYTII